MRTGLIAAMWLASLVMPKPAMQGNFEAPNRPKSVVKTSHLGPNAVAITCLNGADPTGQKVGSVLIISCGKGQ